MYLNILCDFQAQHGVSDMLPEEAGKSGRGQWTNAPTARWLGRFLLHRHWCEFDIASKKGWNPQGYILFQRSSKCWSFRGEVAVSFMEGCPHKQQAVFSLASLMLWWKHLRLFPKICFTSQDSEFPLNIAKPNDHGRKGFGEEWSANF